jgi:hypothetical protein
LMLDKIQIHPILGEEILQKLQKKNDKLFT